MNQDVQIVGLGTVATYDVAENLTYSQITVPTSEAAIRYIDSRGVGALRPAFFRVSRMSQLVTLTTAIPGDLAFFPMNSTDGGKSGLYILTNSPPTALGNWRQISILYYPQ